jgi:ribosomal protein L35AE/L33A
MAEAGNSTQFIKLYSKATIMGYQRNHHYQRRSCSLLKIEGVNNKDDAEVSWTHALCHFVVAVTWPTTSRKLLESARRCLSL